MTTKSSGKAEPVRQAGPAPEEIRAAYQAHTLAQVLYGQLTMGHPWVAQQAPPQVPYGCAPWVGYPTQAVFPSWPPVCGHDPSLRR